MPPSLSSNKPLRRPDHEEKPEVKAGYIHMPKINAALVPEASKSQTREPFFCIV
jgi:hypothetical protein